jgi:hypothetical protein
MELQDVSVDAAGKLQLTRPAAAPHPVDPSVTGESHAAEQPDADTVREDLIERQVQQEAEQSVEAEAREEASSAEPSEPGALTVDRPPAE